MVLERPRAKKRTKKHLKNGLIDGLSLSKKKLGVERLGVPLAESGHFATFAESSCCVALSTLLLALSAKIIQKVTINSALYQLVPLF